MNAAATVSKNDTRLHPGRERGSDIIDLQDFAGHADPRTTLTYILHPLTPFPGQTS